DRPRPLLLREVGHPRGSEQDRPPGRPAAAALQRPLPRRRDRHDQLQRERLEAGAAAADGGHRLRGRAGGRAPRGGALMGASNANPRRAMAPRAGERGMTLMELLAALAIFAGVAGMVVQILGGGLDLWSTGERTRDDSEQATALLDRIALELRHAVSCDGGDG